jgi:hypothetical protein
VWSTGSKLDGQPDMYLESPNHHAENVEYAEIASFAPFGGASPGAVVATTSTVYGADLLVAGMTPGGPEVRKYAFERAAPDAATLAPKLVTTLPRISAEPTPLAGR